MTSGSLENLARIGSLKAEPFSRSDFDGLLRSGMRRLLDARNAKLSLDSRFDLAYNASHALALAALRLHGYRADNRYIDHPGQQSLADVQLAVVLCDVPFVVCCVQDAPPLRGKA